MASFLPLVGGAIGGLGSIIGGGKQASGAEAAAQAQVQAAQIAAQTELQKFAEGKAALQPFIDYGTNALGAVQSLTGTGPGATASSVLTSPLTSIPDASYTPFNITTDQLKQTPGFQFQLATGSDIIKNQLTSQGGRAISGATGTSLLQFGEGLAESTWQQQLASYISQYQQKLAGVSQTQAEKAQTYNMLTGQVNTGASGATSLLGAAVNTGGQVAQAQLAGGAGAAAGYIGAANAGAGAITGATGNIANSLALYSAMQQNPGLYGQTPAYNQGFAGTPGGPYSYGAGGYTGFGPFQ